MFVFVLLGLCALSLVAAAPGQLASSLQPAAAAAGLEKRCVNSASDRSCWGDYSLSTDYYDVDAVPDTGVVREYWFNIVNGTAAPDGIERVVLTVNGSVPGPTIIADWGDTVGKLHASSRVCRAKPRWNYSFANRISQLSMSPIPW
jgi:hypothetical protein